MSNTWLLNHRSNDRENHIPGRSSEYWIHSKPNQSKQMMTCEQVSRGDDVVMRLLKNMGHKAKGKTLIHGNVIHKSMAPDYVPWIESYCRTKFSPWNSLSPDEQRIHIQGESRGWTLFVILWSPHTTLYNGETHYRLVTGQCIAPITE